MGERYVIDEDDGRYYETSHLPVALHVEYLSIYYTLLVVIVVACDGISLPVEYFRAFRPWRSQ